MAHFAKLDADNKVIEVVVVNNDVIKDEQGVEQEWLGVKFLAELTGGHLNWVQTSYNKAFRKNYAGVGYTFDKTRNAFIPPKPYPSWLLNENTCFWIPPVPYPTDGFYYEWDEENQQWVKIN